MLKKYAIIIILSCLGNWVQTQNSGKIPLPTKLEHRFPRLYVTQDEKQGLEKTIREEAWAKEVLSGLHQRIDQHVERHVKDPEWIVSRLQMHWKTKAANIYVNGINFSHADGEAPVPTVRFAGSRDYTTPYGKPKLADILPYMDDERGLYLPNNSKEGKPFEWVAQSKTGRIINSINDEIMGLARDAAFIYWLEGEERFAQFAFDIFDTYMAGMYYRKEPIDLLKGHIQTLVGFTNFQVIHEGILKTIAELYDFLHPYLDEKHPDNIPNYDETIKRWSDQIIKNGVPQNNWNLHQAKTILKAAMVLQKNESYKDGKGRGYYIDYILNVTSARQWSLTKFLDYGYDENNGVWAECPGYSQGVTKDLTNFIRDFDNTFDFNILPYTPVMEKAVKMLPQYLFPNGQTVAFGDTYYGPISTESMTDMIRIAQKNGDARLEETFTSMYRLFDSKSRRSDARRRSSPRISSYFADKPLHLNPAYKAGELSDYITQTFYAPNVSWHVQRIGTGTDGLMVSLNASLGNHMHANGINMELYGKGFVQGADPGKGAGYLQPIYLEFYSQFPAHNTVMVDGISSYTEMLSNHAFDLVGAYPKSEQREGYYPSITYSDVYFLEPETQSDQSRLVSIIKTGETTGYYLDIFRSKKKRKGDKFHDYFYHNLGQSMTVRSPGGPPLSLAPSEEMAFAGGHLYALDYQWDKKSIRLNEDYEAEWKIAMPDGDDVFMNLWMKGTAGREIFTLKSPPCKSFRKGSPIPYDVDKAPYLTFAARQHGEAWDHPFVSVYEPYTSQEGRSIDRIQGFEDEKAGPEFVGLEVQHKSGRVDYIFSSKAGTTAKYQDMSSDAPYALIGTEKNGNQVLFIGNGSSLSTKDISISSLDSGNVVFKQEDGKLSLHNEVTVSISFNQKTKSFEPGAMRVITFE